jgi:hypothetical protein
MTLPTLRLRDPLPRTLATIRLSPLPSPHAIPSFMALGSGFFFVVA